MCFSDYNTITQKKQKMKKLLLIIAIVGCGSAVSAQTINESLYAKVENKVIPATRNGYLFTYNKVTDAENATLNYTDKLELAYYRHTALIFKADITKGRKLIIKDLDPGVGAKEAQKLTVALFAKIAAN